MRWENKGQIKERLLLVPLNEGLLCAAFTEDGIPKRPTCQQPRPIRVTKCRESSPEKKRPPRGLQPPMAMSVLPKGPPLLVPQSTITPSQEQRQGACCLQDAMGPAQGYLNPYIHWDQSQQLRQSTQLQAESPFSSVFYNGRKHGRCGLFSDRTNAFAMGMPAQLMLPQNSNRSCELSEGNRGGMESIMFGPA